MVEGCLGDALIGQFCWQELNTQMYTFLLSCRNPSYSDVLCTRKESDLYFLPSTWNSEEEEQSFLQIGCVLVKKVALIKYSGSGHPNNWHSFSHCWGKRLTTSGDLAQQSLFYVFRRHSLCLVANLHLPLFLHGLSTYRNRNVLSL